MIKAVPHLKSRLTTIEVELQVLREEVGKITQEKTSAHAFSALKGLWKGQGGFSAEEIEQAQYKFSDKL